MSLFKEAPYELDYKVKSAKLLQELTEEFHYQYENSSVYRKIVQSDGFSTDSKFTKLSDLPFLPVQYFKQAGDQLKIDDSKVHRVLSSSATSGTPSKISVNQETAKRQIKALINVLGDFIGKTRKPFFICDIEMKLDVAQRSNLPARMAAMQGFLTFSSSKKYLLEELDNGSYAVKVESLKKYLEENDDPLVICGFTFLLYASLLKPLIDSGEKLKLPKGSYIVHIGGWKKLESEKVSRETLIKSCEDIFGLGAENIIDVYGFTEQLGSLYPECSEGNKHTATFSDVIVRDALTFKEIKDGETGIGQFLSLVPHSYPGFSLLTDDLIKVEGREQCPCGRKGTYFKILGRAATAEIRGCGDVIAEKLLKKSVGVKIKSSEIRTSYLVIPDHGNMLVKKPFEIESIEAGLKKSLLNLKKTKVDDLVGVILEACNVWDTDPKFEPYKKQGLGYIINWIRSGQLQQLLDFSMRGSRLSLDQFVKSNFDHRKFRAVGRGIAVHWLAGNVPTLGFLSLIISIVAKNANVIKIPFSADPLLAQMIAVFDDITYTPIGERAATPGSVVSDSISIVYVDHKSLDNAKISELADVRIAWGGADAVKSIVNLPKRYDTVDVVFGPKLSLACVGREALQKVSKARRVARNLAVDVSVFDQEACASAHNIFVEEGGEVSPLEFSKLLAVELEIMKEQIPITKINPGTLGKVKGARMDYHLNGEVISAYGLEWSVLYSESNKMQDPVYGRTAFVNSIKNLEDVAPLLSGDNQVVGLALPTTRKTEIAELYAAAGVDRITSVGHMADFSFPWDGIFPVENFVRWVSLS